MWEAILCGIFFAGHTYCRQYFATATYGLCIAIWLFLSNYPIDSSLPDRKDFLKTLCKTQPSPDTECRICYDEAAPRVKLPCCGLALCRDCVQRVFVHRPRDPTESYAVRFERVWNPQRPRSGCPMCRTLVYREAAPWHLTHYKLAICTIVVSAVSTALWFGILVSQYAYLSRVRFAFALLRCCTLPVYCCSLVLAYCRMDRRGVEWWWRLADLRVVNFCLGASVGLPIRVFEIEEMARYVVVSVASGKWEGTDAFLY